MALHLLLEKSVGALTAQQEELLRAARNDTERLLRILHDLLDLARLEEGSAGLRKESVAPGRVAPRSDRGLRRKGRLAKS